MRGSDPLSEEEKPQEKVYLLINQDTSLYDPLYDENDPLYDENDPLYDKKTRPRHEIVNLTSEGVNNLKKSFEPRNYRLIAISDSTLIEADKYDYIQSVYSLICKLKNKGPNYVTFDEITELKKIVDASSSVNEIVGKSLKNLKTLLANWNKEHKGLSKRSFLVPEISDLEISDLRALKNHLEESKLPESLQLTRQNMDPLIDQLTRQNMDPLIDQNQSKIILTKEQIECCRKLESLYWDGFDDESPLKRDEEIIIKVLPSITGYDLSQILETYKSSTYLSIFTHEASEIVALRKLVQKTGDNVKIPKDKISECISGTGTSTSRSRADKIDTITPWENPTTGTDKILNKIIGELAKPSESSASIQNKR